MISPKPDSGINPHFDLSTASSARLKWLGVAHRLWVVDSTP